MNGSNRTSAHWQRKATTADNLFETVAVENNGPAPQQRAKAIMTWRITRTNPNIALTLQQILLMSWMNVIAWRDGPPLRQLQRRG